MVRLGTDILRYDCLIHKLLVDHNLHLRRRVDIPSFQFFRWFYIFQFLNIQRLMRIGFVAATDIRFDLLGYRNSQANIDIHLDDWLLCKLNWLDTGIYRKLMYISKCQAHPVDTKPPYDNHYPKHSLELMVFHTSKLLDSMHTCLCSDKLDSNLHPNDILHSNRKQPKRMG